MKMRARTLAVWAVLLVAGAAGYTVDCNHEYTDCDTELSKMTEDEELPTLKTSAPLVISTSLPTTTTPEPKSTETITEMTTETTIVHTEAPEEVKPQPRLLNLNVDELQNFANALHNQTDKSSKKLTDLSDVTIDDDEEEVPKTNENQHNKDIADKFYSNLEAPFHSLMSGKSESGEIEMCKENGVGYKIGDKIDRACDETCECTASGIFECSPRCKHPYIRRGRRLNDPLCFESPVDSCCSIIACATGNGDSKLSKLEVCKYNNETYTVGMRWYNGCESTCYCEPHSIVTCKPRCKPLSLSDKCINVQDPSDACCEVQVCDVSQDAHELTDNGTTSTTASTPQGVTEAEEEEERVSIKRPLVLTEPIGSIKVLQNNSVQVNLMHPNNTVDPIHLLLSEDGGNNFKDVELKYSNLILNLEGGKDYILKTKETGTKFNFTITAFDNGKVNEVEEKQNGSKEGCWEDGKFYGVGEEFRIGCTELCECTGPDTHECVALVCPNHVGLEIMSKGCVKWAPSPPAQPPNCCPRSARCLSDGTCHFNGVPVPNWSEVPISLTGCEQRCFCENGDLDCQEVCTPLPSVPPQTFRCPPLHRPAPVNISDEDCCKRWGCVPIAGQKGYQSYSMPAHIEATKYVTSVPPIFSPVTTQVLPDPPVATDPMTAFYNHLNPFKSLKFSKTMTPPSTSVNDQIERSEGNSSFSSINNIEYKNTQTSSSILTSNKYWPKHATKIKMLKPHKTHTLEISHSHNEDTNNDLSTSNWTDLIESGPSLKIKSGKSQVASEKNYWRNFVPKATVLPTTESSKGTANYYRTHPHKPKQHKSSVLYRNPQTAKVLRFSNNHTESNDAGNNITVFAVGDIGSPIKTIQAEPPMVTSSDYKKRNKQKNTSPIYKSQTILNKPVHKQLDRRVNFVMAGDEITDILHPSCEPDDEFSDHEDNNESADSSHEVTKKLPIAQVVNDLIYFRPTHQKKSALLKVVAPLKNPDYSNPKIISESVVKPISKYFFEPIVTNKTDYILSKSDNHPSNTILNKHPQISNYSGKRVSVLKTTVLKSSKPNDSHQVFWTQSPKSHVLTKQPNPYETVLLRAVQKPKYVISSKPGQKLSSLQVPSKAYTAMDLEHLLNQMEVQSEVNRNLERSADKNQGPTGGHTPPMLPNFPPQKPHSPSFLPTIPPEHYHEDEDYDPTGIHQPSPPEQSDLPGFPPGLPGLPPGVQLPSSFGDMNKKLTVITIESDSTTSIKMLLGLPPALVGLRGSVDLRYTDKADADMSHWYSQVFAPADEVLTTPRLEFRLTGLMPGTTYKVRGKLYLHNLPVSPESDTYSVRTQDLASVGPVEEKRREVNSGLTAVDVNDTTAHVSWKHFNEEELQFIDGIQVRYRPVGTPIYSMTELLHHSRSTAELHDLRPGSRYEASLVLIPPPRATTELHDPGRIEFTTAPYIDPYNWTVQIEVRSVGAEAAELTWRGVPSPAERWVRVYRAAHACGDQAGKEHDEFRLAARDQPLSVTLTGLVPDTRCRVWLELFLTNGKVKTSNVLEINTKTLDTDNPIDNEIEASGQSGSARGRPRGDYYTALVSVGVVAALGAFTSLLLLLVVVRRHRPRSVPITPVPSAPRESSLPPYDNPAYKLELQQETMDL